MPRVIAGIVSAVFCALALAACAATDAAQSPIESSADSPPVLAPVEQIPEFDPSLVPQVLSNDQSRIDPIPASADLLVPLPPASPSLPTAIAEPIRLEIISPIDGSGVEVAATRIIGRTSAAAVDINGIPVEVNEDGSFQRDLPLREGVNLLEIVASTASGRTKSEQIVVFVVLPIAALPFSLLYPFDGVVMKTPTIPIVGVTQSDAVVGVNGIPVEVNDLGNFSTTLTLEEGDNLIEVVATDIREVRFQTVAVFYLP